MAERIAYLIAGFLRNSLTKEEHDELDEWIVASDENTMLFEELTDTDNLEAMLEWRRHVDRQKALNQIKENIGIRKQRRPFLRTLWPLTIAVACLLAIAAGAYFFVIKQDNQRQTIEGETAAKPKDSGGKAVLTLASGRTIILDNEGTGLLATEGNISIKKGAEGELIYDGRDTAMKYNLVTTPRGAQYKIVLGDGTKVWLNAESSVKFPAGFSGQQREVELKGEGYFEVATVPSSSPNGGGQKKIPFIVQVGSMKVEVLGTHFNINSYGDEAVVKTTLLEGMVNIEKGSESVVLHPGQQAQAGNHIKVVNIDAAKEVAWKDGLFLFRDAPIEIIGAQIARWYDVDVEYKGPVPYHFNATIDRKEPLSSVLTALEATKHVRFTREGRKLIIAPGA